MGKVLKAVGRIVVPLAFTAIGFAVGGPLGASIGGLIGSTLSSTLLSSTKRPPQSETQLGRLQARFDPQAARKIVLGTRTAMPADVLYYEPSGTDDEYIDYIIPVAAHKVGSVDEIWFDDIKAWAVSGGVQGIYVGYLTNVDVRLEGTAANTIAINGGTRWGTSCRLTGCAYLRLRIKRTGNSEGVQSPLASGLPGRVTIIGKGMPEYDPRYDSTRGGSGTQRADDQSTWGASTGNPIIQSLNVLLGWRINGKLSVGAGLPPKYIDFDSAITAANICDEDIALAAGGTQKRYRTAGAFSTEDAPMAIVASLLSGCAGDLLDSEGKLSFLIKTNTLATPAVTFGDDDILSGGSWDPMGGETNLPNIISGTFTDPSDNSLYQPAPYPSVSLDSEDGIERTLPLDMLVVEDAARAQRLCKQTLQRKQYPGTFSAEYNMKGLAAKVGTIVWQTYSPRGWVNKPFRVVSQKPSRTGRIALVLREENAAIYAWEAEDSASVQAATPVAFDPRNTGPILLARLAGKTADWPNVTDTEGTKPQDNATVGAPTGTYVDGILAQDLTTATTGNTLALANIASDGQLTPDEKKTLVARNSEMDALYTVLVARAAQFSGVTAVSTALAACTTAKGAWETYRNALSPAWNAYGTTTAVTRATFNTKLIGYQQALNDLFDSMVGQAGREAEWDSVKDVTGTRPQNNATSGDNSISNPSFKTNTAGWVFSGAGTRIVDGGVAYAAIAVGSLTAETISPVQRIPAVPGATFITLRAKKSTANNHTTFNYISITVRCRRADGAAITTFSNVRPVGYEATNNHLTTSPDLYQFSLTFPAGTVEIELTIAGVNTGGTVGGIHITDIRMARSQIGADQTSENDKVKNTEYGATSGDNDIRNPAVATDTAYWRLTADGQTPVYPPTVVVGGQKYMDAGTGTKVLNPNCSEANPYPVQLSAIVGPTLRVSALARRSSGSDRTDSRLRLFVRFELSNGSFTDLPNLSPDGIVTGNFVTDTPTRFEWTVPVPAGAKRYSLYLGAYALGGTQGTVLVTNVRSSTTQLGATDGATSGVSGNLKDSTGTKLKDVDVRNIDLRLSGSSGQLYLLRSDTSNVDMLDLSDAGIADFAYLPSIALTDSRITGKSLANLDATANTKLGGIESGATVGAAWGTNLTGRPTELTDGRISAGLAANGDIARNLPTTIKANITADEISDGTTYKRFQATERTKLSGVETGATVGGKIGTNIRKSNDAVATEAEILTSLGTAADVSNVAGVAAATVKDNAARAALGLNSSGDVARPLPTTIKTAITADDISDGTTYKRYQATERTKLSGIQSGAQVNPANLAALDSTANTKLSGIQTGADVTASNQHLIDDVLDLEVEADYTGAVIGGLPAVISFRRLLGTTDVSENTVYALLSHPGCAATINNTAGSAQRGDVTVTDVTARQGSLTVSAQYGGVTRYKQIAVRRNDAPPPASGSAGDPASTNMLTNPGYETTHQVMTEVLAVTVGPSGEVALTAPITYTANNGTVSNTTAMAAKWQYSATGYSGWTDVAAEITGSNALRYYSTVEPKGAVNSPGSVSVAQTKTGLTDGATATFRLVGRMVSGGQGFASVTGTATAAPQ